MLPCVKNFDSDSLPNRFPHLLAARQYLRDGIVTRAERQAVAQGLCDLERTIGAVQTNARSSQLTSQ